MGCSKHSPSQLTSLPYAQEPKAARELVAQVLKKKPPSDVAKAAAKLVKDAAALEAALAKLTRPQAAYARRSPTATPSCPRGPRRSGS